MNRESYSQRQQILMRRLIVLHTKPIYDALQSQMKLAAAYVRQNGLKDPSFDLGVINKEIDKAVINLYQDAAKRGKRNYMCVKRFGGGTDFISRVLNYLKIHILDKVVVPISNTTASVISRTIQDAVKNGWGVEKTAKFLETAPITKARARMIIRTESVRATNLAQLLAAEDESYQIEKEWIAVEDKRTRVTHTHAGVDGQITNLDLPFSNGLHYPGDPNGSAAEVINCRCVMGFRVQRDTNGRPVKKIANPANRLS